MVGAVVVVLFVGAGGAGAGATTGAGPTTGAGASTGAEATAGAGARTGAGATTGAGPTGGGTGPKIWSIPALTFAAILVIQPCKVAGEGLTVGFGLTRVVSTMFYQFISIELAGLWDEQRTTLASQVATGGGATKVPSNLTPFTPARAVLSCCAVAGVTSPRYAITSGNCLDVITAR